MFSNQDIGVQWNASSSSGSIDPSLAIQMIDVTKKFGDFTANDHVNFDLRKGEVHAILGENGAGKSTLMNILYGMIQPTSGDVYVYGNPLICRSPSDAIGAGIGMVHQHFMLIPPFTVLENVVLGEEPTKALGQIDEERARQRIEEISRSYGLAIDLDEKIQNITVGMQQRVEIIKALYRGAETLILDEPTAVLTPQEIRELSAIIRNLCAEGKSVIIITHKLNEIKEMAQRCTIIRRGVVQGTVDVANVTEKQLASMMVGREVIMEVKKEDKAPGKPVLEVRNLHVKNAKGLLAVNGLDLTLRAGEILGIAGIDGNGQSELVEAITGLRSVDSGEILVEGKNLTNAKPRQIIDSQVAHIPEDRQKRGLVLSFTIEDNMIIEHVHQMPYSKHGILQRDVIEKHANELIRDFDVRPPDPLRRAHALSGGNQQKVIIAREVAADPVVLIAAQPTRGLDVGAIEYVHRALVEQRDEGRAVLLVSFQLDEVMNVSDRIAVIYEGKIVRVLDAKNADENEIGLLMAGGESQ